MAASNVTIAPATGSVLPIGGATNITATSSTKTITEILLLQIVADPTDATLMYATQSPFTISFTPIRLGSANFESITVFSDNTYALTTLTYTLQPPATPSALTLVNAPVASMTLGASTIVRAKAQLSGALVDVTQAATYTPASGSHNVFSVGSGGSITATGNGVDTLIVAYSGVTAAATVSVGSCTYSLGTSNQIAPSAGGPVEVQVAAPAGCSWSATGGASWLTPNNASGSGAGTIDLTAAANGTGSTRAALIVLTGRVL